MHPGGNRAGRATAARREFEPDTLEVLPRDDRHESFLRATPIELRREYMPLLASWFREKFAVFAAAGRHMIKAKDQTTLAYSLCERYRAQVSSVARMRGEYAAAP